MTNKDTHLIYENYQNKLQKVDEGLFDVGKAKLAGLGGAVSGLGQRAKGMVKSAASGMKGDVKGVKAGQKMVYKGKTAGTLAKIQNYQATANNKISKLSNEIFSDLQMLGIDLAGVSKDSINVFKSNMENAFKQLVNDVKKGKTPAKQVNVPSNNPMSAPKINP
jgi:hypothetical protein